MSRLSYDEAFVQAVAQADRLNMDVGIERDALNGGYRTFLLPRPENRYGYELRCEVVKPRTPLTAAQAAIRDAKGVA